MYCSGLAYVGLELTLTEVVLLFYCYTWSVLVGLWSVARGPLFTLLPTAPKWGG